MTAFIYTYLSCLQWEERTPCTFLTQGSYAAVRETGKTLAKGSKSLGNTCLCLFSKQIAVIDYLFKIYDKQIF